VFRLLAECVVDVDDDVFAVSAGSRDPRIEGESGEPRGVDHLDLYSRGRGLLEPYDAPRFFAPPNLAGGIRAAGEIIPGERLENVVLVVP